MTVQPSMYYRRSVLSAVWVEDNELLTAQQGYDMGDSIEGYCLDAPDVLPFGSVRKYRDHLFHFTNRR